MAGAAYTEPFARIYDDVMNTVPYDLWTQYLYELFDYYDKNPENALDLACGTGNISFRLAEKGLEITGVDKSASMLEIAADKADKKDLDIKWVQSDLRELELNGKFDLAISLFDSLNYVLDFEGLKTIFNNVHQLLNKEGVFIFDLNTIHRLMSIEPGTTMLNGDYYTCFWQDIIDHDQTKWQVRLKIYLEDDRLNYYEELHEETSYPMAEVENALYEAGFSYVDIFKAYTFKQGSNKDNRLYFIGFKTPPAAGTSSLFARILNSLSWKLKKIFLR